ncbi:serine protease [Cognatishimia maritima]|uniref:Putative peptidoglycan binding domain-containing protein n=1 Tax=Cognatishimia maritima TaxID=870908 RepID=A0A1M5UXC6_9RHOB|nr:trypsin-like peptidase domain-containing protein [Cognatishimia maritima]SHH67697.1 Putative peptidoglycan binding domain-containing protein [Cognatishimia maritima]
MSRLFLSILFVILTVGRPAFAQEDIAWVQIEAQPSLTEANTEIRNYASRLEDVNGFALGGGWYGIALGPYTREDAEVVLNTYRNDGLIPRDSYITFSSTFESQFWPVGANLLNLRLEAPVAEPETDASLTTEESAAEADVEIAIPDETPREARASEARLSRAEKQELQTWLQWAGFYNSAIDGAFGRGTRASMSAWQAANGHETTGVLTTAQRAQLKAQYNAVLDGLDLQPYTSLEAGIEIMIPTGVVEKVSAEYPFVNFASTGDIEAQVVLISQAGNQATLFGLYDIMQTLELVPLEGPRERRNNSFVLVGEDANRISHTEVELEGGEIKGFTLVWPAGDEERRRRLLSEMRNSFTRLDGVMDPSVGSEALQDLDLLSGLEIRRPKMSRSGFYIDRSGTVVTTAEVVGNCQRITLDNDYDAELMGVNDQLGVAVLRPSTRLAPMSVATFSEATPRLQSEVAVAGYSFEGALGAPTVTFGTLADLRGLQGEEELTRLALAPLPGDAGGPVFDAGGSVVGMLLPPPSASDRQLPADVSFAARGDLIRAVLSEEGITTATNTANAAMPPEDLTTLAGEITVLVSCW